MRLDPGSVRALRVATPPVVGAIVALAVLLAIPSRRPAARPRIESARLKGTRAEDCAPCHAREVAQWRSSAMAFAVRSPLVGALESFVEEQVGRDSTCPAGAGVLRARGGDACVDTRTGLAVTGAGGQEWCVNCHSPGENLSASMPPWSARRDGAAREPARDLLAPASLEGISCAACHSTVGPVAAHASRPRGYEGNATWTSVATGAVFLARPEDETGLTGIANSGYSPEPLLLLGGARDGARVHPDPPASTDRYLRSSAFCGACHDVRLFGTDVRGAARGEHFKRLRNAYSEWRAWANAEERAGRTAPSCQDCHMNLYPGVCERGGAASEGCPSGFHFEARAPGEYAHGLVAPSSAQPVPLASHRFTSVDVPLSPELPDAIIDAPGLDDQGVPLGLRARRELLLRRTFRFELGDARRAGATLEVPVVLENIGAGHRVPAGFSQERETWVELRVIDGRGAAVYEVGVLDAPDADLGDKRFLRVTASDALLDGAGRPLGLFGADVVDGPDVPAWSPDPRLGGTRFVGRGLLNLQNGFQRCVRCIGEIDASGRCVAGPGQGLTRADRFADGAYDADTGECRSNLDGDAALFETYFPVGSLDADRGVVKAPDAIVDTRSAPPGLPLTYVYELTTAGRTGPFRVRARLLFRPFPPYLVRAFAAYEREQARAGERPSGPQVVESMLDRDEPVELASAEVTVP
jgi:eukaryotic-like serine/threonine-protein kinase